LIISPEGLTVSIVAASGSKGFFPVEQPVTASPANSVAEINSLLEVSLVSLKNLNVIYLLTHSCISLEEAFSFKELIFEISTSTS